MKNKAKLAFDLLEQEMEVICKEDQIRFVGGSGGYTWQQIVDAINNGNFSQLPEGMYITADGENSFSVFGVNLNEVIALKKSPAVGSSSGYWAWENHFTGSYGSFWLSSGGYVESGGSGGGSDYVPVGDPLIRADGSRITNADVNGDGTASLIELEYWYRNGGGAPININASSLSMNGVDPNLFKGLVVGQSIGVNLLYSDFFGEGALYGELEFIYQGGDKVSIVSNLYNFDVGADVGHPWFDSGAGFFRNVGTVLGNIAAGSGDEYMINFIGNATLNFNPNE